MEDLDTPRVVPGAADDILRTLERFGLTWDGEVVTQSSRLAAYDEAFEDLLRRKEIYACACSRADLARAASAPAPGEGRDLSRHLPQRSATGPRCPRLSLPRAPWPLHLRRSSLRLSFRRRPRSSVGDFVVKRADGPYAYQLAVVVDDAAQGVTEVVRGADLLDSTARQIALQRALGAADAGVRAPAARPRRGREEAGQAGRRAARRLARRVTSARLVRLCAQGAGTGPGRYAGRSSGPLRPGAHSGPEDL